MTGVLAFSTCWHSSVLIPAVIMHSLIIISIIFSSSHSLAIVRKAIVLKAIVIHHLIIPKWHPTHLHVLHLHVTLCIECTCKHLAILLMQKRRYELFNACNSIIMSYCNWNSTHLNFRLAGFGSKFKVAFLVELFEIYIEGYKDRDD